MSAPQLTLRHEFVRKALHLAMAVVPIAYAAGVSRGVLEMALMVAAVIASLIEVLRRVSPTIGTTFERLLGVLMRPSERLSVTGATWLILSCLGAVLVLSPPAAIAALWCATVGDPAATIAGRLWSARRDTRVDRKNRKTLAGSLACAGASFVGVYLLAGYAPAAAAAIALVAAAAEALPLRIDDNILVAASAGVIAQLFA